MKTDQIIEQFKAIKRSDECPLLFVEVDVRRAEIQQRLAELTGWPNGELLSAKAMDHAGKMRAEVEQLEIELDRLAPIQQLLIDKQQTLRTAELRVAIPLAVKSLPAKHKKVLSALADLKAAIGEYSSTMLAVGDYAEAGLPMPLSDDESAAAAELREQLWHLPTLACLTVPFDRERFPKSWGYHWTLRGLDGAEQIHSMRPHPKLPPPPQASIPATKGFLAKLKQAIGQ